jgi:hypothetical protein
MGLTYKYRKYGCITLIILIVVCFFGYAFYINHKANLEFYKLSFSGKVIEKKINSVNRGSTIIKFSNGELQDLGVYYSDRESNIEIGDSVFKPKNSYNIFSKLVNGTIVNCTREDFKNKSMRVN